MHTPKPQPAPEKKTLRRPSDVLRPEPSKLPEKGLLQQGMDALRRVGTVQALVAFAALGAAGVGVHQYKASVAAADEAEHNRFAQPYTSEQYPTVEDRLKYLKENFGFEAQVLDGSELRDHNFIASQNKKVNKGACGCVIEHMSEQELPRKVEKGDPKHFLAFLDDICRACDMLPREIFREMEGKKIFMSGLITVRDQPNVQLGGYANGGLMVISYSQDSRQNQSTFHHEFFHTLDAVHNGLIQDDDQWMKRSGMHKKYTGYTWEHSNSYVDMPDGFVRQYSLSSVPEDQATFLESMMQPHYLKFLLRRAKYDAPLRTKIQLLTASVIDDTTERFSRTMTEKEYAAYSGFPQYRYFQAWAPSMNHDFWNKLLDRLSVDEDGSKALSIARNINDGIADFLHHGIAEGLQDSGIYGWAGEHFEEAQEKPLARASFVKAVELAEQEPTKVVGNTLQHLPHYYAGAGNIEKANELYVQAAILAANQQAFSIAAINYARGHQLGKAQEYALKFFTEQNYQIRAGSPHVSMEDMFEVIEVCYDWKNLPEIVVNTLHRLAKKDKGFHAIMIYENLDEVDEMVEGQNVRMWYLKQAKKFEKKSQPADQIAHLYERAGDWSKAESFMSVYFHQQAKMGNVSLAGAYRVFADFISRKERASKEAAARQASSEE